MKKVLVIRNVSYETEGMLEQLLRDEGLELNIVDFQQDASAEPSLDGHAGLVVMGGPMGANETDRYPYLLQVERLCAEAMERSVPLVGVCLGAQIMAKILGSEVYPNPVREVGWYDLTTTDAGQGDALFSELDLNEVVLPVARGHLRPPEGRRSACVLTGLRQPGVSLRRERLRSAISPGDNGVDDQGMGQQGLRARMAGQGRPHQRPAHPRRYRDLHGPLGGHRPSRIHAFCPHDLRLIHRSAPSCM